jgi:hypothetical protein
MEAGADERLEPIPEWVKDWRRAIRNAEERRWEREGKSHEERVVLRRKLRENDRLEYKQWRRDEQRENERRERGEQEKGEDMDDPYYAYQW